MKERKALVVELVDTPVLGTGALRHAGSSPAKGKYKNR